MITAYFDGCCEPKNPGGHAAYGITINWNNGTPIFCKGEYIGSGEGISNNVAEYQGLIAILEILKDYKKEKIEIKGDSMLAIEQMSGHWRMKKGAYIPYALKAQKLIKKFKRKIDFEWIPREQNDVCDKLAKDVLRERGIVFKIQPEVI